jgi:signal transduction histidine kinase
MLARIRLPLPSFRRFRLGRGGPKSLRFRLVLLSGTLVVLVALALSALHVDSLVDSLSSSAIKSSDMASALVFSFLRERIREHYSDYREATDQEDMRSIVYQILSTDREIGGMLVEALARSNYFVEINVAAAGSGEILVSSDPHRVGASMARLRDFSAWEGSPEPARLRDLLARRGGDYQMVTEAGESDLGPLYKVQVVVSSVLMRVALLKELQRLAIVSGLALLLTLLVTVLATNRVLRPVKRIEETIDRIAQGKHSQQQVSRAVAKEFAIVESKLNLLGQQFRGARDHASELRLNVDKLLESMASQLDVASRLAAISKLTSGVAHEIKNPLNAIALRLDLLRAKWGEPDEEVSRELDILSKEVLRLDRVVKTFLDFSRPVEVHFQEADLCALAKEIVDLMAPQAHSARIALQLETPPEPVRLRADPDMLKQAILNLVANAMEAMKSGGDLRLKVDQPDGLVLLEVADSGPGIPAELRDKVFQLYFTTKTRGSGIGLAMTYRAVQLHNGTIGFTSEVGRGTTFRLQFPSAVRHA